MWQITDAMRTKARIGMALALPEFIKPKPGALNNMLQKLERECKKRLAGMIGRSYLFPTEELAVSRKIEAFGRATGWEKNQKHLATYIAFLLALFDRYPEDGIIAALNDIARFLEAGNNSPWACLPAGAQAFEKWEEVWKS